MKLIRITIVMACLIAALPLSAQDQVRRILAEIEANNPALAAARHSAEAERDGALSEAALEDPEVEFNYLWGQDSEVGNRKDFSITQSFDMASLSGLRARHANALADLSSLSYQDARREVLLEADRLLVELVYLDKLRKEYDMHKDHAQLLVKATERKNELGEASMLDVKKARLHLASVQGEIKGIEVQENAVNAQLIMLNGGKLLNFAPDSYAAYEFPEDFDAWYASVSENIPALKYAEKSLDVEKMQLGIDKSSWLPKLTVGYMSELGLTDRYRGLTMGVSIPLWKNSRKIQQSNARVAAGENLLKAETNRFYFGFRQKYEQALGLKAVADEYRIALNESDMREYLMTAQSSGEISMIDYLVETDMYYDSLKEYLGAERDYMLSLAELNSILL